MGRTPIVIGKKEVRMLRQVNQSSLPNLDYEIEICGDQAEIIRLRADRMEQMHKPNEGMQICSFFGILWISCFML